MQNSTIRTSHTRVELDQFFLQLVSHGINQNLSRILGGSRLDWSRVPGRRHICGSRVGCSSHHLTRSSRHRLRWCSPGVHGRLNNRRRPRSGEHRRFCRKDGGCSTAQLNQVRMLHVIVINVIELEDPMIVPLTVARHPCKYGRYTIPSASTCRCPSLIDIAEAIVTARKETIRNIFVYQRLVSHRSLVAGLDTLQGHTSLWGCCMSSRRR